MAIFTSKLVNYQIVTISKTLTTINLAVNHPDWFASGAIQSHTGRGAIAGLQHESRDIDVSEQKSNIYIYNIYMYDIIY